MRFMQAKNKKLMIQNKEILLEGVGLGGWFLPEGYMWGSHSYFDRPRRFEELVSRYYDNPELFWRQYYQNWISDQDFIDIKELGFNSIRLPLHFRLLMEENEDTSEVVFKEQGFKLIDYTIQQCRKMNLYIILDLHSAPGGQTGQNIDDSKYDKPELFTKEIYQKQTVKLWEELAKRYNDESLIVMYDLLNEPLPNWNKDLFSKLEPFHERLVNAIRKYDQNHMISIEGAHWATDFSTITRPLDDNVVLHFHKYWSPYGVETIQPYLDKRDALNLPLIMGEGGENDLYWYSAAFKMYTQHNISWNFWAYKKVKNHNSIKSFDLPEGFKKLYDKEHPLPKNEGKALLDTFLENIKYANTKTNTDVRNHLFNRVSFSILASGYDYLADSVHVEKPVSNPVFRDDDGIKVVDGNNKRFSHNWHAKKKADKKNGFYPYLNVSKGDYYRYTFNTPIKTNRIVIEIKHEALIFDAFINGESMKINDNKYITFSPSNAKNILSIHPKNTGLLKAIEFKL